jgi:hypothetical protein
MSHHTLDNIHDGLNDLSIDKKYHVHALAAIDLSFMQVSRNVRGLKIL